MDRVSRDQGFSGQGGVRVELECRHLEWGRGMANIYSTVAVPRWNPNRVGLFGLGGGFAAQSLIKSSLEGGRTMIGFEMGWQGGRYSMGVPAGGCEP